MKLLIITYSYTPDLTPRAFRWAAVAGQLASRGHEVHVLCAGAGERESFVEGVTVHRVGDWLLHGMGNVTVGARGMLTPETRKSFKSLLLAFVRKPLRSLWRIFYWPDYACGWAAPAMMAGRALQAETKFDWIISSSHPFTGHLVGRWIARQKSPVRWLVDISDPYCLMKEPSPYNKWLYGWLSRMAERQVVSQADVVSVTTESTSRLYQVHFPAARGKVHVIPPVLSLPPFPARARSDEVLRIVFVGTLYRKLRSPRFLLDCFATLHAAYPTRLMELHFYGAVNDCAEELLSCPESVRAAVFIHGLVTRPVVLQAMVDADVLVNIGNDSETQLASKVVEYMAVGRPILNIVSLDKDTSVEALAAYPSVLTMRRESNEPSAEMMASLAGFLFNLPSVPAGCVKEVRERYEPARISQQYACLIEVAQKKVAKIRV